ncbi:MAG: ferrous iron transport protein A [Clostridia bacterium]|nr:ferrous iron transport protein A [Clostridia bacterium]
MGCGKHGHHHGKRQAAQRSLIRGELNQPYTIKSIETCNEEMKDFLFTLGCYPGESVTMVSAISDHFVIVVKDARYSIDKSLAKCIIIR